MRTDEWYNFKNMNPEVNVLITIDEKSYEGGKNGENHPMAWYHEYGGGRSIQHWAIPKNPIPNLCFCNTCCVAFATPWAMI